MGQAVIIIIIIITRLIPNIRLPPATCPVTTIVAVVIITTIVLVDTTPAVIATVEGQARLEEWAPVASVVWLRPVSLPAAALPRQWRQGETILVVLIIITTVVVVIILMAARITTITPTVECEVILSICL
jgi:hypothetical protein